MRAALAELVALCQAYELREAELRRQLWWWRVVAGVLTLLLLVAL